MNTNALLFLMIALAALVYIGTRKNAGANASVTAPPPVPQWTPPPTPTATSRKVGNGLGGLLKSGIGAIFGSNAVLVNGGYSGTAGGYADGNPHSIGL